MRAAAAAGRQAGWLFFLVLGLAVAPVLHAQGVDVTELKVTRDEGGLVLDFAGRLNLSKPVEEALARGVPLHFVAEAQVLRPRWWWRDERVARSSRSWRLSYQPLTNSWQVRTDGLSLPPLATQEEALRLVGRILRWRISEGAAIDADTRYVVQFRFRLDTTQLPSPMQLGLGALSEWTLEVERTLKVP